MKLEPVLNDNDFPFITLTNKVVIELSEAREKMGKSWNDLVEWLHVLGEEKQDVVFRNVRHSVERLNERKQQLSRNKEKKVLEEFMNEIFKLPVKKERETEAVDQVSILYQEALNKHVSEIEVLIASVDESNTEVEKLTQVVKEQSVLNNSKSARRLSATVGATKNEKNM